MNVCSLVTQCDQVWYDFNNHYAYCLSGTNYFHFLFSRVKIPFTKVLSPLWSIPNMKESDDIIVFDEPLSTSWSVCPGFGL